MRVDSSMRHCAACYGQYEGGGIDFEAAFDGPTLKGVEVAVGQPMAIDDLFICRKCLQTAAKFLDPPLVNAPDLIAHNGVLEERIAELEEQDRLNVKAIADLQRANDTLSVRAGGGPGPIVKHAQQIRAESDLLIRQRNEQAGAIPTKRQADDERREELAALPSE